MLHKGPLIEPAISVSLPSPIQAVFAKSSKDTKLGALAIDVVTTQLKVYNASKADSMASRKGGAPASLFDAVLASIADQLGDEPEEDLKLIQSIPEDVVKRAVWKWDKLPYSSCATLGAKGDFHSDPMNSEIDDWVLRNERHLRDSKPEHWSDGLVRLSMHADTVFPVSTLNNSARSITRPTLTPGNKGIGYTFLDQKRASSIQIQPSVSAFAKTFEQMSDGLLRGLNWNNICVAGGLALGVLMSPDDTEVGAAAPSHWKNSDIDIYIYGLGPVQANQKLQHIFETFKSNLPAGAPVLVVRNSKTITFFSNFPIRRLQVVLKRVESPREVLLNFDLDICAVAWDGREVWLLPRACRAVQTGYNVFTMNLINGHYLGERRASQEQRVFKYASKGYGIRILPDYVDSLQESEKERKFLSTRANKLQRLDIHKIAENARMWTDRIVARYLEWNYRNQLHYVDGYNVRLRPEFLGSRVPVFTHLLLDSRVQKTEERGARSCLTGFELLMRHVRLWEKECAGELLIQDDVWASTTYEEVYNELTYDDTPKYEWNESFDMDAFKRSLYRFNLEEEKTFNEHYECKLNNSIRRCSFATTVDEILDPLSDIVSGLGIPKILVKFTNKLVVEALEDCEITAEAPLRLQQRNEDAIPFPYDDDDDDDDDDDEELHPVLWRISSLNMWQLLDRRIDEVYEMLWAVRRANERPHLELAERVKLFKIQASRRAIRPPTTDDYTEFARWVGRIPVDGSSWYPGIGQGFWTDDDFADWERLNIFRDDA